MSWRKVLALGGVASAIAIGCTVTVTEGPLDGGPDESGGSTGTGGAIGDASTGGKSTGGKGGSGGASTGGKGGASTGGKGGASTGGKAGAGTGGKDAMVTECMPDKTQECDYCVETKCCQEWLDCVNDVDCFQTVDGNPPEYACISGCLLNDGGNFPTIEECAGSCKHDAVGISTATNGLIVCMMATGTGDAGNTQNCTNECFLREL